MSADSAGELFDPEIHATDRDGNPSLNKDGTFRKKRKDAGRKTPAKPAAASGGGGRGGKADAQHAEYAKQVAGVLQVPATLLSLADPVDGYCAAQLVKPWSDAIADLALQYPQVAAAIEKAAVVGPLTGLVGVGMLTIAQFGMNHGKVPENIGTMFGARPRAEIEQILKQRGDQLAAAAAEQQRQDAEDAASAAEINDMIHATRAEKRAAAEAGSEHGYAAAV
ncbi:hypothetical protein ACIQMZ_37305 [Streptomyces longwoodensis]|uniref:hypothetical protein n=1 Tax=Streptomyces longwoodensis TaxID=68231 RepID=UPI003812BAC8